MRRLKPYLIGAIGGVLGMLLLPLSGLLPISAMPGRPGILDWYFGMAAQQSISLQSLTLEVPALDDPKRVERAAGHYEMVCAACHGSPVAPARQLADNLSPSPPPLMERMDQWHPTARIFWTIKHGIRHTAMPGWASQLRDDEVWDMVAFVETLPNLDPAAYAELASGETANDCTRCHGEKGEGALAGVPRLDIQSPAYIEAALKAFRDGTRQSGTMMTAARTLSNAEIAELARHYGQGVAIEANAETTGAAIARSGIPDRDVPACEACHGVGGRRDYPRLAGQDADYLLNQLKLFAELGAARGGQRASIMAEVVRGLTPEEMEALADFYGRQ